MSRSDLPNESSGECWPTAKATLDSSPTAAPTAVAGTLGAIAQSLGLSSSLGGDGTERDALLRLEHQVAMDGIRPELYLDYSSWLWTQADVELARLGLTWKSERVRAFFARCNPIRPTLDGQEDAAIEALLGKLRSL